MSSISETAQNCKNKTEADIESLMTTGPTDTNLIPSVNEKEMSLEDSNISSVESKLMTSETGGDECNLKQGDSPKMKSTLTPEITKKRKMSELILNTSVHPEVSDSYLTLSGTIRRSKKSGQKETDVQITIRKEDLMEMKPNPEISKSYESSAKSQICSAIQGTLTLILTILSIPFVFIASSFYSFYIGTITWHNFFSVYSEEENFFYRITVSPLLMLMYPLYIVICTLSVGVYSAFVQVQCNFSQWLKEIQDLEKGFYGWLCRALSIEDCCPYELVILTEVRQSLPEQI